MRPSSLLYSFLLVSTAFSALDASAGLPNYKSRKIESKNGQYVLVLLTPKAERQKLSNFVAFFEVDPNYWTTGLDRKVSLDRRNW